MIYSSCMCVPLTVCVQVGSCVCMYTCVCTCTCACVYGVGFGKTSWTGGGSWRMTTGETMEERFRKLKVITSRGGTFGQCDPGSFSVSAWGRAGGYG